MIVSKCVEPKIKMKSMDEGEDFGIRCAVEHDGQLPAYGIRPRLSKLLVSTGFTAARFVLLTHFSQESCHRFSYLTPIPLLFISLMHLSGTYLSRFLGVSKLPR